MKDKKDKKIDMRFVIRGMYCAFFIAIFVITVLICLMYQCSVILRISEKTMCGLAMTGTIQACVMLWETP